MGSRSISLKQMENVYWNLLFHSKLAHTHKNTRINTMALMLHLVDLPPYPCGFHPFYGDYHVAYLFRAFGPKVINANIVSYITRKQS